MKKNQNVFLCADGSRIIIDGNISMETAKEIIKLAKDNVASKYQHTGNEDYFGMLHSEVDLLVKKHMQNHSLFSASNA